MDHSLANLIGWYCAQCDGNWEHAHGIRIRTLDNPGFLVEVDLTMTFLENASFQPIDWESASNCDEEWFTCYKSDEKKWIGACSPKMLERVINIFVEWSLMAPESYKRSGNE